MTVDFTHADVTYRPIPAIALPSLVIGQDLNDQINWMINQMATRRMAMELRDLYYRGENAIADLGISIPPQMKALRVPLGWPRVTVDALNSRLNLDGFRYPDSDDVDADMQEIWVDNNMDAEAPMANLDALVFGRGYISVGTREGERDRPLIAVESPLDVYVRYDARRRVEDLALRTYSPDGEADGAPTRATLYLPGRTLHLMKVGGVWELAAEPDDHGVEGISLVRIANRARSYDRDGFSEITPELMTLTDEASRTLQSMAVAREFYSAPQRYVLGADQSSFEDAEGNKKTPWEAYLGRVWAMERDAEGELPSVGQFQAYDPSVFTKVIDTYAKAVSALTSVPPQQLGYTTDNPASADAIRSSENALVMKALLKCATLGVDYSRGMQLARRIAGHPDDKQRIVAVWGNPATPTPAATADALTKYVAAGVYPARSDVTLELSGLSAAQRSRLMKDWQMQDGLDAAEQLAASLQAPQRPQRPVGGQTGASGQQPPERQ